MFIRAGLSSILLPKGPVPLVSGSFLIPKRLVPLGSAYKPEPKAGIFPVFSSSVFDITDGLDSLIMPSVSVFASSCLNGNRGDGFF